MHSTQPEVLELILFALNIYEKHTSQYSRLSDEVQLMSVGIVLENFHRFVNSDRVDDCSINFVRVAKKYQIANRFMAL